MVDRLWNRSVGQSGTSRFVAGIADGLGINTFTLGQDSQIEPYRRALYGRQRTWVRQLQAGQPISNR